MTYPRPGGASRLPLHAVAAARPALDPNHKHRKKKAEKKANNIKRPKAQAVSPRGHKPVGTDKNAASTWGR